MTRRRCFCVGITVAFAFLVLSTAHQEKSAAQIREHRFITVSGTWRGGEVVTGLDPEEMWVKRGTTVTWVNESEADIQMKFFDGEDCKEVRAKAVGQLINRRKCLVTVDFKSTPLEPLGL